MSTYEFTERTAIIFSRWIKIELPKVMKYMEIVKAEEEYDEDQFEEQYYRLIYQDWVAKFNINFLDCLDGNDELNFNSIWCEVDIKRRHGGGGCSFMGCLGDPTEKDILEELKKMVGSYNLCDCMFRTVKAGTFCDNCAPFILPHPNNEDCPICLDNREGVWVQTDCKHIFHLSCWEKVESKKIAGSLKKKCPLCRTACCTILENI